MPMSPRHPTLVTHIDKPITTAVHAVDAVADDAAGIDATAEVRLDGPHTVADVTRRDLAQVVVGGPLGHEIEHAGRVRRPVQRGREDR